MTTVILDKFLRKLSAYPNGLKDFKDNIDVLVTLNADRRQRNEKRNKRREEATNGGSDENIDAVSDDEDDYLTPIIHALKQIADSDIITGRSVQPLQQDHIPEETDSESFGFTDEGASQRGTSSMKDNSFPKALFDLAINHKSPPLTLFTFESLKRIRYGNIDYPKCPTSEKPS